MMNKNLVIGTMFLMSAQLMAQDEPYILSDRGAVAIKPVYQSWTLKDLNTRVSQIATVFSGRYPASKKLNFSFRVAQATASGDIKKLAGTSDLQIGVGGYIESADLAVSAGFNLPTGKTNLSTDEFETASIISNPLLDYAVPSWGQGFNVNPGVAWVRQVSPRVAVGIATAYQYKGTYTPRDGEGEYNPGDELILTGGADFGLTETSSLAADVVFTLYGTDKVGGIEVFAPGNALSFNVKYKSRIKNDDFWIYARYRSKAKGDFPTRVEPNRAELQANYTFAVSRSFSLALGVSGRLYEETGAAFSGANLIGFVLAPTFLLSPTIHLPVRLRYLTGSSSVATTSGIRNDKIHGFEAGISLITNF